MNTGLERLATRATYFSAQARSFQQRLALEQEARRLRIEASTTLAAIASFVSICTIIGSHTPGVREVSVGLTVLAVVKMGVDRCRKLPSQWF